MNRLKAIAKEVAITILDISYRAKTGHVGSALAISDILTVLYFSAMNISRKNLSSQRRDRFILSKGHAAAALYSVLYKKRIISKKQLESFGQEYGLCEHPEIKENGVEMTTGSLGHGLAFAVGIAYGLKLQNIKSNVFVLISDGESGEGSVWEAALLAPRLLLNNLIAITDYNKWQCFGPTPEITKLDPLAKKWQCFGWNVIETKGHNLEEIKKAIDIAKKEKEKPTMIIAYTIMGRGISTIENQLIGHYKVFNHDEYKVARKELQKL